MGINLDISPQHLKDLLAMLRQYLPDTPVWAFGSRVKFTAKSASDLDLVAFVPEKQETSLSLLKEALAESDLPFKVDLHDWNDLPETFKKNIESGYVVIQEGKKEDVPNGWKTYRLGELVDPKRGITYGVVQPGEFLTDDGVPILKVNNLTERKYSIKDAFRISSEVESKYERSRLIGNEILVSLVGSLGYIYKVRKELIGWNVVRAIGVLPIKEEFDKDWIYWSLKSPDIQRDFQRQATTTVQATLNLKELRDIEIKYPEANVRCVITSILNSLDDKIELNLQMNQTLEAMAQAIFKEWFVAFRYPGADGVLVDGVPKGLRMGSILEIAYLLNGGTPKTENERFWNGDIKWISAKDVTTNNGNFVVSTEKSITQEGLKNSSAKLLPKYSTVISARGTVGNYCIIPEEMTISQSNYGLKSKKEYGDFFLFLMLENMIELMKAYSYGTVFDTITTKTFKEMEVVIPDETIATAFNSLVEPLYLKIYSNSIQNLNLSHLRDSLLPRLMAGKIEIKN